jgi:hypothetical protein
MSTKASAGRAAKMHFEGDDRSRTMYGEAATYPNRQKNSDMVINATTLMNAEERYRIISISLK